jgi:5-methylcytosine-specific restriction endonuclease McrA
MSKYQITKDLYDRTSAWGFITGGWLRPKIHRKRWKTKALTRQRPKLDAAYYAHIDSGKWKEFRRSIIAERGKRCERCGRDQGILNLHHLHYENFGNENREDVQLLCVPCHAIADRERKMAAKLRRRQGQSFF